MVDFNSSRIAGMDNEELTQIIQNSSDYVVEAVDLALAELTKRGVRIPTLDLCKICGRQYSPSPTDGIGMCKKCYQEKPLREQENRNKDWNKAVQNKQVIVCSIANPNRSTLGSLKNTFSVNPQGLFKKAEIGFIGTDIVFRTITDLSEVHYSSIPLQEIKWASWRASIGKSILRGAHSIFSALVAA